MMKKELNVGGGGALEVIIQTKSTKFVDLSISERQNTLYSYIKGEAENNIYKKIDSRKIGLVLETSRETIDNTWNKLIENGYIETLDNNRIWRLKK